MLATHRPAHGRRAGGGALLVHGSLELAWEAAQSTGTVVFPPDDADEAERVLRKAQPLAAVFIEPVLGSGGVLSVPTEVLLALRRVTQETGALLVFDEVMSFRLSHGGAQECVGVLPDMTALGKIVGGGLPIGAVVGRADILEITDRGVTTILKRRYLQRTAGNGAGCSPERRSPGDRAPQPAGRQLAGKLDAAVAAATARPVVSDPRRLNSSTDPPGMCTGGGREPAARLRPPATLLTCRWSIAASFWRSVSRCASRRP